MDETQPSDELVELAKQIERGLIEESTGNTPSSPTLRSPTGSTVEADQIHRIGNALGFIHKVRKEMESHGAATAQEGQSAHADASTVFTHDEFELPSHIGRFELIKVLGQGGFARVFLARDPNLDRLVAIKVPRPNVLVSKDAKSRFDREALAAAVLSHPRIVPLFETGASGPFNYLVYGYCEGQTLNQWLAAHGSVSPIRAAWLISELADAVQHAHQRGVVHRDLKPANVLVARDSNPDKPNIQITDFGLAKFESNDQFATTEGAIVGTPAYMSPEQASGEKNISNPTDIYSLGIILYELLTGKVPFLSDSTLGTLESIRKSDPIPPRQISAIPPDVDAICLKAIQKRPDQRYQSAHELRTDLLRFIEGVPVEARRQSHLEKSIRWLRHNAVMATLALLMLVSLTGGLLSYYFQSKSNAYNYRTALEQNERANEHLRAHEKTADEVIQLYTEQLERRTELDSSELELLDRMVRVHKTLIEQEGNNLRVEPGLIRNYERLTNIFKLLGNYEEATQYGLTAINLIETVKKGAPNFAELQKLKYRLLFGQLLVEIDFGNDDAIDSAIGRASKFLNDTEKLKLTVEEDALNRYRLFQAIGLVELRRLQFDKSFAAYSMSAASLNTLVELSSSTDPFRYVVEQLESKQDLGKINQAQENHLAALDYFYSVYQAVEDLPEQIANRKDIRYVHCTSRSDFARSLAFLRRRKTALTHYEVAIDTFEELVSNFQDYSIRDSYVDTLCKTVELAINMNLYRKADRFCDRAINLLEDLPENNLRSSQRIRLMSRKGFLLLDEDYEHGLDYLKQTAIQAQKYLAKYPDSRDHLRWYANCLFQTGFRAFELNDFEETNRIAEEAIPVYRKLIAAENIKRVQVTRYCMILSFRALTLVTNDQTDKAIEILKSAIEDAPRHPVMYQDLSRNLTHGLSNIVNVRQLEIDPNAIAELETMLIELLTEIPKNRSFDPPLNLEREFWTVWPRLDEMKKIAQSKTD